MLDHLGLHDQAAQLREAVDATTGSGVLTRDVGGTASTGQVVAVIIENLALRPAVLPAQGT
jgi:tartrate dehydrogenase/decarboxylase / D-malate dehydrogenase